MNVETLRSSIQAETRIDPSAQHLYHNGVLITDNTKTMEQLQIGDGDMLALHVRDMRGSTGIPAAGGSGTSSSSRPPAAAQPGPARSGRPAGQADPEVIRLQILGNPSYRAELQRTQPHLASVVDDPVRFAAAFSEVTDRERRDRMERQRQIAALNADPFDIEAQAKIEEIIRQERVMENLQNAMEHNPEGQTETPRSCMGGTGTDFSLQFSAMCTCSMSTLRSTATRSKLWWTRAPRQPSCHLHAQKPATSCGW